MRRRVSTAPLLTLSLDRTLGAEPLHRQIYQQVRSGVLEGRLPAGARLPSTRTLANELQCSRNTVVGAFDQLFAEGYIEGQVGSGSYVSRVLPEDLLPVAPAVPAPPPEPENLPRIGRRGAALAALSPPGAAARRGVGPAFVPGLPELSLFPFDLWGRLLAQQWRNPTVGLLRHGMPAGHPALRSAIADYLRGVRALCVEPEQIFVTSGAQQALDLIVRVLLDPDEPVWIEDPGYSGLRGPLLAAGARIVPVPVDQEGLCVEAGRRLCPGARMALVTPARQYPLGISLSLSRRLELIDWAKAAGAWLVEDDYDSEYRYAGRPLAPLMSLQAAAGRVVYVGSFSKVMFPSLRLGYLVVPPALVEVVSRARAALEDHPPVMVQPVLARFIAEGHFAAHVRRMRAVYAGRQAALFEALHDKLEGAVEVDRQEAGLHLLARLPAGSDDRRLSTELLDVGLVAPALSDYYANPPQVGAEAACPALLLGFAAVPEGQMRDGVERLARVLERSAVH
mgnify:CR=1 FL=1